MSSYTSHSPLLSLPSLNSPKFKFPIHPPKSPFLQIRVRVSVSSRIAANSTPIRSGHRVCVLRCGSNSSEMVVEDDQRPPFDLNLAVVLAGFAFEAYTSPPGDVGWREMDGGGCQTVFLSERFYREVYDGQLFIKLKNGTEFPALDLWGTSDPYVVLQLEGQVAKSKVKWASLQPNWNENFAMNLKLSPEKILQVAAWDANLVGPHKRMGNAGIKLESLCDGELHELVVELEGIGGGGKIYLEVKYKSFDEIEKEKQWWRIPLISDFLAKSNFSNALNMVLGSDGINASQFVQSAFGQLNSFNYNYLQKPLDVDKATSHNSTIVSNGSDSYQNDGKALESTSSSPDEVGHLHVSDADANVKSSSNGKHDRPDEYFWKAFADILNQTVLQRLGFSLPEIKMWDGFEMLNKMGVQSRRIAEQEYLESGLATHGNKNSNCVQSESAESGNKDSSERALSPVANGNGSPQVDIKKVARDVLAQTETVFGALMILTGNFPQQKKEPSSPQNDDNDNIFAIFSLQKKEIPSLPQYSDNNNNLTSDTSFSTNNGIPTEGLALNTSEAEEMKKLFSSAESAMEAWAMLATSLGRTSLIKSDFEKICFLDNISTDTQVAIWRDSARRRLVVAFRGTEQSKWKDLATDLMLLPAGLNPERLGGDFKQEVQVHSGFLNAYDSVRHRIITLIKHAIDHQKPEDSEGSEPKPKWQVYATGHSLGGALATLLALELSSSQMAKHGMLAVTMYNFGSPRVGNRKFAELYNEKVKESWRIVNHRDIIPSVPRLMGYCHVAQPIYLAAGDLKEALVHKETYEDGYQGDVIGEATPDDLVSEFMKGEKQLVEKILQTEINLLRSIRDGTALMQHMEDFYYITLLERVRSNYKWMDLPNTSKESQTLTA